MAGGREGRKAVLHPTIAARWEIALLGVRTARVYGALLGLMSDPPEPADLDGVLPEEPTARRVDDDAEMHCARCGCVGDWRWEIVGTERYARYCRDRGEPAVREVLPFGSARWRELSADVEARARARRRAAASAGALAPGPVGAVPSWAP
jgi:hypothetical protein